MSLKKIIKENKLDALFISDLNTIKYLFNFSGSNAYLIYTFNDVFFITDSRYESQAKLETKLNNIYIYNTDLFSVVKNIIKKNKIKHLGFLADKTTYSFYSKLNVLEVKLSSINYALSKLRIIKKKYEINNIRKAIAIQEKSFHSVFPSLLNKTNLTEYTFARQLEATMLLNKAQKISFDTIVAFGKNSALPHHKSSNAKIFKKGFLIIDFGCEYKGYQSDQTLTLCFGALNKTSIKIYDAVYKARELALKMIRPGFSLKDIQNKIDNFFIKQNLKKYVKHSLGHGIGLEIHEEPMNWKHQSTILEENMVFSIEPGVYIPSIGGVRLEDIVRVTNNSYELLTSLSKEKKIIL